MNDKDKKIQHILLMERQTKIKMPKKVFDRAIKLSYDEIDTWFADFFLEIAKEV